MPQSAPAVSVVIPTWSRPASSDTLDSLQAQSLTDWEAIIIDDGSWDTTKDVVSTCRDDARIRYHRLGKTRV